MRDVGVGEICYNFATIPTESKLLPIEKEKERCPELKDHCEKRTWLLKRRIKNALLVIIERAPEPLGFR